MVRLSFLFIFICSFSFSQEIEKSQEQREAILIAKKNQYYKSSIGLKQLLSFKNTYMNIIEERNQIAKNIRVIFDFGQESGFFYVDHIKEENGNFFQIFTVVDALNYLSKLGWEYVNTSSTFINNTRISSYLMKNNGKAITPLVEKN